MRQSSHVGYDEEQLEWIREHIIKASLPAQISVNKITKVKIHAFNTKFGAKRAYASLASKAYEMVREEGLPIYLASVGKSNIKREYSPVEELPASITPANDFKLALENQLTHHKNIVSAIELLIDEL